MTTEYNIGLPPLQMSDLMLLLQYGGLENAVVAEMIASAKITYVNSHHTQAITQLQSANKYKNGNWKTYVMVDGKRKEVVRKTKDELFNYLYNFYKSRENSSATVEAVFERLMVRKRDELGRCDITIREDRRYFSFLSEGIRKEVVTNVTESDLRSWLVRDYMPTKPKETALRKMLQLLRKIFDYAKSQKICFSNPAEYIVFDDYAKDCDHTKKRDEERAFSEEECALLREDALKTKKNPRSIMRLLASETGMRAGELPALLWTDVESDYIHIHRQQVRDRSTGHEQFYDLEYTKDERKHPHGGRYFPRNPKIDQILELAKELPGDSEYVFHDKNGKPIAKNTYLHHLSRACKRLGIETSNNHAFRLAYNSRMIEKGLSPADRALLLGHGVQTNEHHYSVSDRRRLDEITQKLA